MGNIKKDFHDQKYFGLCIIMRHNWFPAIRCFGVKINCYLGNTFNIRMCQLNGHLLPIHFESDLIHVNVSGYELFMDKIVRSIVDHHVSVEVPLAQIKMGVQVKPLCKSTIRRKRKALKLKEEN